MTYVFVENDGKWDDDSYDKIGGPESMWLMLTSPFPACKNLHWEVWRYASYMLIHADMPHLIANTFMCFVCGASVESVHGTLRVMVLYLLGGIGGGFNVGVFTPYSTVVGASGAIYCLIGVILSNVFLNWSEMPYRWFRLLIVMIFIVNDGLMYLYSYDPFTSYTCHGGGFAFGVFFGFVVLKNLRVERWEVYARWLCLIISVGLYAFWLCWWGINELPKPIIPADRKWPPCCPSILALGLPVEGTSNDDYVCVIRGEGEGLWNQEGVVYWDYENAWRGDDV